MLKKLIAIFLLLSVHGLRAQTAADPNPQICVLQHTDNHKLQKYIQILADTETGYSIEDITKPGQQSRFVAFPDKTFDLQSHQPYWGKIQLENRLPEAEMQSEWVLNFSSTFTSLTLYRPTENGAWISEINGSFVPAHQKSFVPTQDGNLFKLVLPPGKVVTLYFRGTSERSSLPPTFHAYLQPLDVFYDKLVAAKSSDGLFAGFLLMMLLFHLLKFFIDAHRS